MAETSPEPITSALRLARPSGGYGALRDRSAPRGNQNALKHGL
jgi:hypothetical protein